MGIFPHSMVIKFSDLPFVQRIPLLISHLKVYLILFIIIFSLGLKCEKFFERYAIKLLTDESSNFSDLSSISAIISI